MSEGGAATDGAVEARTAVAEHRGPGPFPHTVQVRGHAIEVDEPPEYGGHDGGPDPTELLAAALASCTSMTLRVYAGRKGWALDGMRVTVAYAGDATGPRYDVTLDVPDTLDAAQADRLAAIAARCPVRRALSAGATFTEDVKRATAPINLAST